MVEVRRCISISYSPTHPPAHPPTHGIQQHVRTASISSIILAHGEQLNHPPTHPPTCKAWRKQRLALLTLLSGGGQFR